MSRQASMGFALVLTGLVWGGTAGAEEKKNKKPAAGPAPVVHTVIFHLKKNAPEGEAARLVSDVQRMLGRIKSVRGIWAGRPLKTGDKAAKKFDVALVMLFADAKALKTFRDDPLYKKFAQTHMKFVDQEKLSVFDFMSPVIRASITVE